MRKIDGEGKEGKEGEEFKWSNNTKWWMIILERERERVDE